MLENRIHMLINGVTWLRKSLVEKGVEGCKRVQRVYRHGTAADISRRAPGHYSKGRVVVDFIIIFAVVVVVVVLVVIIARLRSSRGKLASAEL